MDKNWKFVRLKYRFRGFLLFWLLSSFDLCWSLNDEGLALVRLKEGIVSDPFGSLINWNEQVDACSWFGVQCSHGRVVALDLSNCCLAGTLSSDVMKLVHLNSIILRNNSFTGVIPEGIGMLKELKVLDLGYNNFSGTFPLELSNNTVVSVDNNEHFSSFSLAVLQLQMVSQADKNQLVDAPKRDVDAAVHRKLLRNLDPFFVLAETDLIVPPSSPGGISSPILPAATAPLSNPVTPLNIPQQSPPPPPPPPLAPPPPFVTTPSPQKQKKHSRSLVGILVGVIGGTMIILLVVGVYIFRKNAVPSVKPWRTGISGQLQRVFVTGVPKLKRSELLAACEDFCNVIGSSQIGTVYKGTLSSGVEISVVSVAVTSSSEWSKNLEMQFRRKIDMLSKVNHKNFVNLLGFCEEEEPFTRIMVFEYAPNGTLFEHLHIKESEQLDWKMRLRIAMGMAYCLDYMHQLNPPIPHNNLTSSSINLTEDYAAKLADFSFWHEMVAAETESSSKRLAETQPKTSLECNVYSFGLLLFEILTGRLPYLGDNGDWAHDYLNGMQTLKEIVDPTLESFDEDQLEKIGELIKSCVHVNPKQRPSMKEVTAALREISTISPDGSNPKISPLWWAELEVLSSAA